MTDQPTTDDNEYTCTVIECSHTETDATDIVEHIKDEHSALEAFGHVYLLNALKVGYDWDEDTVPQINQIKREYSDEIDMMRGIVGEDPIDKPDDDHTHPGRFP